MNLPPIINFLGGRFIVFQSQLLFFTILLSIQAQSQKSAGNTVRVCLNLRRRSASHNASACITAARSHVNYIVSVTDNVQIMLNDNDCCTLGYQTVKNLQKSLHIKRMQTNRRLIEDEHRRILFAFPMQVLGFVPLHRISLELLRLMSDNPVPDPL